MVQAGTVKKEIDNVEKEIINKKTCGIIMPIANTPDYKSGHWAEVLSIIAETLEDTDFNVNLVSSDVAIGLIHERIVNNIYNNEIVICDVSSKNPNVMFELGMRLAFDKPTIIIKDEKTGYSFDTGVIEHLTYPSDLRFSEIVKFKIELKKKFLATYEKSKENDFSPFLKSFGKNIVPTNIQQTYVPQETYIIERLNEISNELFKIRNEKYTSYNNYMNNKNDKFYKNNSLMENIKNIIHNNYFNSEIEKEDFVKKTLLNNGITYPESKFNEIFESLNK